MELASVLEPITSRLLLLLLLVIRLPASMLSVEPKVTVPLKTKSKVAPVPSKTAPEPNADALAAFTVPALMVVVPL